WKNPRSRFGLRRVRLESLTYLLLLLGRRRLLGRAGRLLLRRREVLALLLVRRTHRDQAARRAGHGAEHQHQVVLAVDPHQLRVARGAVLVAVLARHADAPLGPAAAPVARVGRDAAALAVALLDAVAAAEAREVVPLHHAGEAAPLRLARHVDRLDVL